MNLKEIITHPQQLTRYLMKLFKIFALLLFASNAYAACDQTFQSTASASTIESAIASAPNDSTICLDGGTYPNLGLYGITRTGYVNVQSTTATSATFYAEIAGSSYIRLKNLTLAGLYINSCSNHIETDGNVHTDGVYITDDSVTCTYPLAITIGNSSFTGLSGFGYEGVISVRDDGGHQPSLGVTISGNTFTGGTPYNYADGVFLAGGASGVTISGNKFLNMKQDPSPTAAHTDAIQFYGSGWNNSIIGNTFSGGDSYLMLVDFPDNALIKNNVFTNTTQYTRIQIAQNTLKATIDHNTFVNTGMTINYNAVADVTNNIFKDSSYSTAAQGSSPACAVCMADHNMSNVAGFPGTNVTTGEPIFVNTPQVTYNDYGITSASPGYLAGSDGLSLGIVVSVQQPDPFVTYPQLLTLSQDANEAPYQTLNTDLAAHTLKTDSYKLMMDLNENAIVSYLNLGKATLFSPANGWHFVKVSELVTLDADLSALTSSSLNADDSAAYSLLDAKLNVTNFGALK